MLDRIRHRARQVHAIVWRYGVLGFVVYHVIWAAFLGTIAGALHLGVRLEGLGSLGLWAGAYAVNAALAPVRMSLFAAVMALIVRSRTQEV